MIRKLYRCLNLRARQSFGECRRNEGSMKFVVCLAIVASACLLTSCTRFLPPLVSFAHFSAPMKPGDLVETNSAVVYRRFETGAGLAFETRLRCGCVMKDLKKSICSAVEIRSLCMVSSLNRANTLSLDLWPHSWNGEPLDAARFPAPF